MSNGDDVLDSWEELDEAGLCMTLQTKLQTANDDTSSNFKPATTAESATVAAPAPGVGGKMKLLQRPQSLQESNSMTAVAPKQIMIAKKSSPSAPSLDADLNAAPVMMVLHKSSSEYDAATYATPISNQTVKILRRPAQSEERRDTNGMRPKQPIKTLQQREQEYAQARLRILGSAKNPEDDKPATTTSSPVAVTTQAPVELPLPPPIVNFNNNTSSVVSNAPGMHRSSSAPKMSQTAPIYNYNYYQAPPAQAAMGYFYQQQSPSIHQHQSSPLPLPQQQQQQQQQQAPPPHYNQRMSAYGAGVGAAAPPAANPQQSWSPVVGGTVSAALLRQQSMHSPAMQQHQHQHPHQQPPMPQQQYAHPYNDNILRLPRGPCPNGTIGFQMRR